MWSWYKIRRLITIFMLIVATTLLTPAVLSVTIHNLQTISSDTDVYFAMENDFIDACAASMGLLVIATDQSMVELKQVVTLYPEFVYAGDITIFNDSEVTYEEITEWYSGGIQEDTSNLYMVGSGFYYFGRLMLQEEHPILWYNSAKEKTINLYLFD